MTRFGSREVLQILDVKPHVLRYWEQILPLVRSQRDESGHRVWTAAQVRMLQRLRHLVVRRGMSVHAAGEAILREAESAPGNVKAGLEALRSELVATLQRLHEGAGTAGPSRVGGDQADTRVHYDNSPGVVDPVAAGLAPPRGWTGMSRPADQQDAEPRSPEHRVPQPPIEPGGTVRIVYRHLFAFSGGDPSVFRAVPNLLRRILAMRTASSEMPIIVCAPAAATERFRDAFASWTGPELSVASVPMISYRKGVWNSPLLSVVNALATDPAWQTRITTLGARHAYLWAADNPDAPPTLALFPAALADSEVIMTAHPAASHTLIGESLVLRLGDQGLYRRILACGHWSVGPVSVDAGSAGPTSEAAPTARADVEGRARGADTVQQGWRYDIRLRDLRALHPAWYVVPRSPRPSLWRGYDWQSQMPAVWPELGTME